MYIEFFGLFGVSRKYDTLMEKKIEYIKKNKYKLIAIYKKDLTKLRLDTVFRKLL